MKQFSQEEQLLNLHQRFTREYTIDEQHLPKVGDTYYTYPNKIQCKVLSAEYYPSSQLAIVVYAKVGA